MKNKGKKIMNRRKFLGGSMAAAATVSIVPSAGVGLSKIICGTDVSLTKVK